jgi:hypothetical protein
MICEVAKLVCKSGASIYRTSKPEAKYEKDWLKGFEGLDDKIPDADKMATDWKEFDPGPPEWQ